MKFKTSIIFKRVIIFVIITLLLVVGITLWANRKIPNQTQQYIYDSTDAVPAQKTALVLGAARYLKNGRPNPYFTYRINAAKELYDSGKVKFFVLSGDNSRKSYNEPQDMKNALMASGVPENIIYLDYAGFRTLDSVVRMSEIFGQKSFIVVSQQFHNERAIFIGRNYGLEVYGYNAKDIKLSRVSGRTKIREKLARVKVFIDIFTNKKPKYLGEPIEIK